VVRQGIGPRAGLVLRQHLALDLHVGDAGSTRRGDDDLRQPTRGIQDVFGC
jgi:hypothetical protein